MAVENKTLTGAIAIIKYRGVAIGHMRNVQVSETFTRADVRELGNILPLEAPVTQWSGTIQCGFYEIDFTRSGVPNALKRDSQDNNEFQNNVVLEYDGVQIDIYKRIQDAIDPETRKVTPVEKPYATVRRALIESDSIDITEGAVSGRNQSFRYLDPVIQPK
jgi:hypothetical protein